MPLQRVMRRCLALLLLGTSACGGAVLPPPIRPGNDESFVSVPAPDLPGLGSDPAEPYVILPGDVLHLFVGGRPLVADEVVEVLVEDSLQVAGEAVLEDLLPVGQAGCSDLRQEADDLGSVEQRAERVADDRSASKNRRIGDGCIGRDSSPERAPGAVAGARDRGCGEPLRQITGERGEGDLAAPGFVRAVQVLAQALRSSAASEYVVEGQKVIVSESERGVPDQVSCDAAVLEAG